MTILEQLERDARRYADVLIAVLLVAPACGVLVWLIALSAPS